MQKINDRLYSWASDIGAQLQRNVMATDEWGNEWSDDAVPSGTEIAQVMLEIREEFGWQKAWGDCDGLRICPRVRVWLDGYQDRDYEEAYLLRVWTDTAGVTVTDHLAILTNVDGSDSVEWRQDPRLFFDAGGDWLYSGLRWWVDWLEAEIESRHIPTLPDEHHKQLVANSEALRQKHRDEARAAGIVLPYFSKERDDR